MYNYTECTMPLSINFHINHSEFLILSHNILGTVISVEKTVKVT